MKGLPVDEDQRTDPEVDEPPSPSQSPVEEEIPEWQPPEREIREVPTFLGIGVGIIFAVLLGLCAILTAIIFGA